MSAESVSAHGRATVWRERGSTFAWNPPDGAPAVDVFHVEAGYADAPTLLLVHGFPTCSIDWFELTDLLCDRFRVCMLDFPGYGFSAKPKGWGYNLERDAALLDHYLANIVSVQSAVVVAHDRGSSVAIRHALNSAAGAAQSRVDHLVLTNGNVFLPLSNLTDFQRLVLDPQTAPAVLEVMTPQLLAQGMGATTFTPARPPDHPDVVALADTFAHDDGVAVLHETIQYLVERSEHEREWLEQLASLELPTTVIWGINDAIAPPRVPAYVWNEFLMRKPGRNAFYLIPGANHYLQNDRPDALAAALFHSLDSDVASPPGAVDPTSPDSPVLVDRSRAALPDAADVLRRT